MKSAVKKLIVIGCIVAVTPVPGGVGALTTAVLAAHTAKAAARRIK